jgi:hypothetical protein
VSTSVGGGSIAAGLSLPADAAEDSSSFNMASSSGLYGFQNFPPVTSSISKIQGQRRLDVMMPADGEPQSGCWYDFSPAEESWLAVRT